MQAKSTLSQSIFPDRVWVKTSEDMVRRKWMGRWMSGRMKLHEAVLAYEEELGDWGAGERRAAA